MIRSCFKIDKLFFEVVKKLKFIVRVGVGFESIDEVYVEEKNICFIVVFEGNWNVVGEYILGMLFLLFNNLNIVDKEVKNGIWSCESNWGVELDGKMVGFIGYGNMGKVFVKKLKGFDCIVFCYDILEDVGDVNVM